MLTLIPLRILPLGSLGKGTPQRLTPTDPDIGPPIPDDGKVYFTDSEGYFLTDSQGAFLYYQT